MFESFDFSNYQLNGNNFRAKYLPVHEVTYFRFVKFKKRNGWFTFINNACEILSFILGSYLSVNRVRHENR